MGRGELGSPHDVELMGPLVTRDHWYVLASQALYLIYEMYSWRVIQGLGV